MKDEETIYYRIKISRIRERKGTRNNCEYKDELWCVDCRNFVGSGFAFCEKTEKKAFKQLKEMLCL